jgi:hypothetical protein
MDNLFFGLDQPANEDGLVLLRTFHDDVSVTMAEEVLRDEEILFLKKDRGSGSAVRLITGYSMYGTDLLVAPEDLEKASALMAALFDAEGTAESEDEQ